MASSHFENFVKTNQLQSKLYERALKFGNGNYIAKLVLIVFHVFKSNMAVNLKEKM